MGKLNDTARTLNSLFRTLLLAVLVFGVGVATWKGYSLYHEPQRKLTEKQRELDLLANDLKARDAEVARLTQQLGETQEQLNRSLIARQLLKLRHRVARLHVLEQKPDEQTGRIVTTVEFYEVNDAGDPLEKPGRRFEIEGDRVYVECLVVKFDDRYIEQADLDRSTAICLFRRIFGEYQQPQEGYPLDREGSSPNAYSQAGRRTDFEERIWSDFWEFANNREKAAAMGIRAAHADAPSMRVRTGATYELELRSTGEFTIKPVSLKELSSDDFA